MQRFIVVLTFFFALITSAFALDQINISFSQPPNTPYFVGNPEMNIDAEEFTTVVVKIKAEKSGTSRLFFASSYDPQMNVPKSLEFILNKGTKEYVFNVKAQNPNWIGFIGQFLIYPENGPDGIRVESAQALPGNIITGIKSGWREFFMFEVPQLRTVNFIYGPKINGRSVNFYIYLLIIAFSVIAVAFKIGVKKIIIVCLFFWVALDLRILIDQARTVRLDVQTFYGKSLEEKRAAATLGDFYSFLKFADKNLPKGTGFNLLHPSGYYYLEKANYYLYPTHYEPESEYIIVYNPNKTLEVQVNSYLKKGYKVFATYKEGEFILKK